MDLDKPAKPGHYVFAFTVLCLVALAALAGWHFGR